MGGRHCKICFHPERAEIELAITRGDSKRDITGHFGIANSSLYRHINSHMVESLAGTEAAKAIVVRDAATTATIVAERAYQSRGLTVMGELERCFDRVNLIFDACDEWLRDPLDLNKYFIGPRASEIDVLYVEMVGDKEIRSRDTLQRLISRAEETNGFEAVLLQSRQADPRDTLLKAAKSLHNSISFLAKLRDQIGDQTGMDEGNANAWRSIRAAIMEALEPYPEAKLAVIERLAKIQ